MNHYVTDEYHSNMSKIMKLAGDGTDWNAKFSKAVDDLGYELSHETPYKDGPMTAPIPADARNRYAYPCIIMQKPK